MPTSANELTAILAGVVLLGAGHAIGCQCAEQPAVEDILAGHALVFVGRVVSGNFLGDGSKPGEPYGRQFTFVVSETLKGNVRDQTVTISTGVGGGDCGVDFIIGRQYLVYSRKREDDQFVTSICDYTKEYVPYGQKEAEELRRRLKKAKP
jgi:hypothetical protein